MNDLFDVFSECPAPTARAWGSGHLAPKAGGPPGAKRVLGPTVGPLPTAKRAKEEEEADTRDAALHSSTRPGADQAGPQTDMSADITREDVDVDVAGGGCVHGCMRAKGEPGVQAAKGGASAAGPAKTFGFALDVFQSEAIACLEKNESVLISAPTSSGKTVVAEYAIAMALRDKQRIIYTSPIKALSNQKYRDLEDEFEDVGLMTGDITINPHSSCMIMTTEILRSMLYRGSEVCREMAWVVFDEIHYMRDRERGVIWEEAIILLPDTVRLIFLSATIPNAHEFAEWICRVKHQPCHVISTDRRPVPLQHYLFPSGAEGMFMVVDEGGRFREDNFHRAVSALHGGAETAAGAEPKKVARRRGRGGNADDLERIVRMCSDRGHLPVIVFAFSKKECEAGAVALKKLDVTTDREKQLIGDVFSNAIMTLGDDDRELPQVQSMLPLLRRGLGIHHGGLLPLLKEVVEILFQETLLKVLFSTETFSMGINMPAKTVVFTGTRKWDGLEYRMLHSGEYVQMSGRAGRRGRDDRGLAVIMLDEQVDPDKAKSMFAGRPTELSSAFRLGYNMLINLLRLEGADPDYMIQRSFYHFQMGHATSEIQDQKRGIEAELRGLEDLPSAVHDGAVYPFDVGEAVADYYHVSRELASRREELRQIVTKPEHISPYLQPGRLLHMRDGDTDWGWGILVDASTEELANARTDGAVLEPSAGSRWVLDVLLPCAPCLPGSGGPHPPASAQPEGQVLSMALALVHRISKICCSRMPAGDPRSEASRRELLRTLAAIKAHKKMRDGIPVLDPVLEMGIRTGEILGVLEAVGDLEGKLAGNGLHGSSRARAYIAAFERKVKLHARAQDLDQQINRHRLHGLSDVARAMCRLLRRLEYIDHDGVVLLKGRMACELTAADEVLMTEIVFQNVFADLDANSVVALCSCLVFDDKCEDTATRSLELARALETMRGIARGLAEVMLESKVPVDVEEYVSRLRPQLMHVVLGWLEGKRFYEIMNHCSLYEGTVVRTIRRLEELVRELAGAAKAIGNQELERKLNDGRSRLKRGLIFSASLYL